MNVLIIGSGGREHVLAWKIDQSPLCDHLYVAPGNAGTEVLATNVDMDVNDFESMGQFCLGNKIELIVVGPEEPLVKGLKDYFKMHQYLNRIKVFGPDQKAAQLEGSKAFAKEFMTHMKIPTAQAKCFNAAQLHQGISFLQSLKPPYVLKADGLAAGKGVLILNSLEEAESSLMDMLEGKRFGEASSNVLVEEYLSGIELSVFVLTDGRHYKILPEAKDYKRIGEGDTGPNTGGMGAVSPVFFADREFMRRVEERIIQPTIQGLVQNQMDYVGFIFIGLMNVNGDPYVIEYNIRMGDPEAEAVIPRIKSDLLPLINACIKGTLESVEMEIDERTATTIILASQGYPNGYEKGKYIEHLDDIEEVLAFHAGTKRSASQVLTNGGRVMALTALASDLPTALEQCNRAAATIEWDGRYYRKDIGLDLLRLNQ